ncbi:MAG: LCP family protein [Lachnospiraceae bacterium]|nr:LCP family protein [Lachnospiraceae bacterium]
MASGSGNKSRRSARRRRRRRTALLITEILVFFALVAALFIILKWDKVDKETLDQSEIYYNEEVTQQIEEHVEKGEDSWKMSGYKNVALFGVDAGETRTDTIMIASLNQDTGDIRLCSVYRDTYLNLGNDTYNKANGAYARGGAEQAIKMLNMNLDLTIDDYITVNFQALEDVINDLGGIEIDVQAEEIGFLNDYQTSIVQGLGGGKPTGETVIPVTSAGLQTLNGLQATAYCRIRYTKGDDFRRTERQRTVLKEIAKKAKTAGLPTLNKIIDDVLPEVKTSMTASEFADYAAKAAGLNVVDAQGFPFERVTGTMGKAGSCVVADDMGQNVEELHAFLYGESDYSPTNTVQEISKKIQNDRNAYGL